MPPIPSPYNFVPLSEHVYFPGWASQVSQDVPFSDGISGWLEIEVEATTPIYIRNGGVFPAETKEERRARLDDPKWLSFFRLYDGGPFAVPGTELKGMLRNVVEIASFAKLPPVDDRKHAVRDLKNPDPRLYREHLTQGSAKTGYEPKARAGWLRQNAVGSWEIQPCEMARVEQRDLEHFARAPGQPAVQLGRSQSSADKYQLWSRAGLNLDVNFDVDDKPILYGPNDERSHSKALRYRWARNVRAGNRGVLVFTGQPQNREENFHRVPGRKHMEFIFYSNLSTVLPVPDETWEDFRFVHSEPHGEPNEELAFWLAQLRAGAKQMPVFFITDTQGETTRINAMGLALMFRLPYNATPDQLADKQQQPRARQEKFLDLAECIFGRSVESNSLRGRVHIETFEGMKGACQERSEPVTTVLNSPKPTFYPNYLEQPIARDQDGRHDPSGHLAAGASYSTWMDDGENGRPAARIRGWKRYATSPDTAPISWPYPPMRNNRPNLDVATRFRPLNAGAKFRGRIHIHNLRRVELGALLWAITWGGNDALRHRLGMAKPLGFGTVVLRLTGQADLCATDAAQISVPLDASTVGLLRDEFTQAMQQWCTSPSIRLPDWEQTPQIRALVALANPEYRWPMKLTHPERVKDFANYKSAAQALLPPETKELPPPHQSPLPPKPAPEPPVVLPNLAGQERRVSFLRTTRLPKRASDSLIFRLKEGSDKFEARLDDPQRPDLCCQLHSGASFELFIVGAEEGVYLLSETKPD